MAAYNPYQKFSKLSDDAVKCEACGKYKGLLKSVYCVSNLLHRVCDDCANIMSSFPSTSRSCIPCRRRDENLMTQTLPQNGNLMVQTLPQYDSWSYNRVGAVSNYNEYQRNLELSPSSSSTSCSSNAPFNTLLLPMNNYREESKYLTNSCSSNITLSSPSGSSSNSSSHYPVSESQDSAHYSSIHQRVHDYVWQAQVTNRLPGRRESNSLTNTGSSTLVPSDSSQSTYTPFTFESQNPVRSSRNHQREIYDYTFQASAVGTNRPPRHRESDYLSNSSSNITLSSPSGSSSHSNSYYQYSFEDQNSVRSSNNHQREVTDYTCQASAAETIKLPRHRWNSTRSSCDSLSDDKIENLDHRLPFILCSSPIKHSNCNCSGLLNGNLVTTWNNYLESSCSHDSNDYFCHTCSQICCSQCLAKHRDHHYLNFEGNSNLLRTSIQKHQEMISMLEKIYNRKIENLDQNCSGTANRVTASADCFKMCLESRKNTLLADVEKASNSECQFIKSEGKELNVAKGKLSVIESCLPLRNTQDLIKALTKCKRMIENFASVKGDDDIAFVPNDVELNEVIKRSGSLQVAKNSACVKNSKVSGTATTTLTVNQDNYFTITCYNYNNERLLQGNEEITAVITYPDGTKDDLSITDFQNGSYQGVITTTLRERHHLSILLRGIEITSYKPIAVKRRSITEIRDPTNSVKSEGESQFKGLHCARDGTIYVTDEKFHCVLVYSHEMKFIRKFGTPGNNDGELHSPSGITIDKDNRLIVADKNNHRIQIFNTDGTFLYKFGNQGTREGEFIHPWDVATNSKGYIAVSELGNRNSFNKDNDSSRIQLFDSSGNFISASKTFRIIVPQYPSICFDNDNSILATFNRNGLLRLALDDSQTMTKDEEFSIRGNFGSLHELTCPKGIRVFGGKLFVIQWYHCNSGKIIIIYPKKDRDTGSAYPSTTHVKPLILQFVPINIAMSPDGYLYAIEQDKIHKL